MNRFKRLDVVYRVPEELWTEEVSNIVQQAMTKTTPKKMKCKKAKWLSEEVLQIAEERRESQRRAMPKNADTTIQLHSFHMLARLPW